MSGTTTYEDLAQSIGELGDGIDRLREQRDELLAACVETVALLSDHTKTGLIAGRADLLARLGAAIAHAEAPR